MKEKRNRREKVGNDGKSIFRTGGNDCKNKGGKRDGSRCYELLEVLVPVHKNFSQIIQKFHIKPMILLQ
jgi:hypothetical protein